MKRQKHKTGDEKRLMTIKKHDYMQKLEMTPEQRKAWDRKPYGLGDKK